MSKYNNSKIYRIVCNNTGLVYYGSTTQKYLSNRLSQHRKYQNCSSKKIIDEGNYEILLVENVDCNSKDELRARERFYIENNECVNKNIPGRTKKEYQKKYQKEYAKKYQKYRTENKEKIKEYHKKYRTENKEKISERNKEKLTCSCGSIFRKKDKARHERTQKHLKSISN